MKQQKLQGIQSIIGKIAGTLLLLVLFSMFSCTNDQEQDIALLPVEFELSQMQTRATDTTFDNDDKIGIYAVESGKTFLESGNYADNRQYSYKDGQFRPISSAEQIYVVKGKSYTYYAYYPYRSGIDPSNVEFNAVNITTKDRPLWSMNNTNSGNVVRLTFENIFGLVEVNINETADKIVSGVMLKKLPKASVNLCSKVVSTSTSQSPASIPLTLYNSQSSISTFRTLLPTGNNISSGDELFNFVTASSKAKKYYATENTSIVAGVKNVFNLTLLEEYLIKATSTAGGNITDATAWASGKTFQDGQSCSLPFTANPGYYFDGVYENNFKQNCTSSPYTFAVTGNRTLEVRFKPNVITYGNWVVSVSANPTTIAAGGGTSTISASATRDILTNGIKTGTDTGTPTLSASGTGFSLSNTTLTASNNTGSSRSCTVTATHGGISKTCTITQSAAQITYGNWVVSVSASPTTIAADGGTSTISASATRDIFTNGTKTGSDTTDPSLSYAGTGFTLSGKTLTASNNTGSSRSCTVTATHGGVSKTCTVTQSAAQITYGNWVVSVSASPTTIAAGGGTSTISASATRDILTNGVKTGTDTGIPTLSANGTGFSLSNTTLTASNNTESSRSCTVTATHGGVSKTCTVTQNGASITYEYSFSVTPTFLSFSSKGGTKSFTVTSTRVKFVNGTSTGTTENVNYTSAVSGVDASGFTVSETSVIASENPTTDFRDATVTLTQTGSGKTVTITLEQERKINIDTEI